MTKSLSFEHRSRVCTINKRFGAAKVLNKYKKRNVDIAIGDVESFLTNRKNVIRRCHRRMDKKGGVK